MNAVRILEFGDSSVLRLEVVPEREPGPIKARYPIDEVATAYDALAGRHGLGKIVLQVGAGA